MSGPLPAPLPAPAPPTPPTPPVPPVPPVVPLLLSGRREQLLAAARRILDIEGFDAVTMRRLGADVGIRGPSIYKHFPDKAAIETALIVMGLTEQADAVAPAPPTFDGIARAYRSWAIGHAHLHRLINGRPLDRAALPPGLEARGSAPLIGACGGDIALARAAWATINGLVDLELAARFPNGTDIGAVYTAAARAFDTATP